MAKRSLLLVDGDARSLRVLEVSLKKAGFTVTTAANGRAALEIVEASPPDLIISNTVLEELDGFEFCRAVKETPALELTPFVFLTDQTEIENKIRGLELGVDEYLIKPIYIKEILTRVRILLQKHDRTSLEGRKESNTRFTGKLSDMGVVDLIQTVEVSHKSGVSHFASLDDQVASLYFRDGRVIDAELGPLTGAEAVYRLLTWSEGDFEVLFRPVRRRDVIALSPQALLMEGMRRLDEWGRLLEQLPPLTTQFEVAYEQLADRLSELPDELNHLLRLFDGHRALMDIVDQTPQGDLESLELIAKLYFEGLVVESRPPPGADWSSEDGDRQAPIDLPPARIREASATELEHDPGDAVYEDLELNTTLEPPSPAPNGAPPREDSLVDLAIGAAAPVFPDLSSLPGRAVPPEVDAEGSTQKAPAESAPSAESLGASAMVADENLGPKAALASEESLARMTPSTRELAMLPNLVERVRHQGRRRESSNPPSKRAPATEPKSPEMADLEAALAETSEGDEDALDSTRPGSASSQPPPIPVAARLRLAPEPEPEPEPDKTAAELPSNVVPLRPLPPPTITAPPSPAALHPIAVLPTVEVEEEAIAKARPSHRYPAFDDDEPLGPGDLEPLPPSAIPAPVSRDLRVISSAGAEIVAVAGAISAAKSGAVQGDSSGGSVVIDDEDLREDDEFVDEPTVEEPLGQRARRSTPPRVPSERRSPLPLFFGVATAAVLIAAILLLSRGHRKAVPEGGGKGSALDGGAGTESRGALDASTPMANPESGIIVSRLADAAAEIVILPDAAALTPREEAQEIAKKATRARARGRHEEALTLINEAISLRPTNRYLAMRADLLLALGKRAEAVLAADAAISKSSGTAAAWLTKGLAHYELREYAKAKAAFQRYLDLRPDARDADEIRSLLETL